MLVDGVENVLVSGERLTVGHLGQRGCVAPLVDPFVSRCCVMAHVMLPLLYVVLFVGGFVFSDCLLLCICA